MLGLDHVWLLNCKQDTSRLNSALTQCRAVGIEPTVVVAVDGHNEPLSSFDAERITISHPGSRGCALSHKKMWKTIVENNVDRVLILEDDIVFHEQFTTLWPGFHHQWASQNKERRHPNDKPIGMLFLGHCSLRGAPHKNAIVEGFPYCLHAYIITYEAARFFLEHWNTCMTNVDLHIRELYDRHADTRTWRSFACWAGASPSKYQQNTRLNVMIHGLVFQNQDQPLAIHRGEDVDTFKEKTVTNNLTLVTMFYDLHRRETKAGSITKPRHDAKFYLQHGQELTLQSRCNLIVFTDPEFVAPIFQFRLARGLGDQTLVVPLPLEQLGTFELLHKLQVNANTRPYKTDNPSKDTPLFFTTVLSKFELVLRAMKSSPWTDTTTHWGWMDFGLGYVARNHAVTLDHIVASLSPTNIQMLMMRPMTDAELTNPTVLFQGFRGRCAGGFWTGSTTRLHEYCQLAQTLARQYVDQGYAFPDEEIQLLIAGQYRPWFDFYYGDYASCMHNRVHMTEHIQTILLTLNHVVQHNMWWYVDDILMKWMHHRLPSASLTQQHMQAWTHAIEALKLNLHARTNTCSLLKSYIERQRQVPVPTRLHMQQSHGHDATAAADVDETWTRIDQAFHTQRWSDVATMCFDCMDRLDPTRYQKWIFALIRMNKLHDAQMIYRFIEDLIRVNSNYRMSFEPILLQFKPLEKLNVEGEKESKLLTLAIFDLSLKVKKNATKCAAKPMDGAAAAASVAHGPTLKFNHLLLKNGQDTNPSLNGNPLKNDTPFPFGPPMRIIRRNAPMPPAPAPAGPAHAEPAPASAFMEAAGQARQLSSNTNMFEAGRPFSQQPFSFPTFSPFADSHPSKPSNPFPIDPFQNAQVMFHNAAFATQTDALTIQQQHQQQQSSKPSTVDAFTPQQLSSLDILIYNCSVENPLTEWIDLKRTYPSLKIMVFHCCAETRADAQRVFGLQWKPCPATQSFEQTIEKYYQDEKRKREFVWIVNTAYVRKQHIDLNIMLDKEGWRLFHDLPKQALSKSTDVMDLIKPTAKGSASAVDTGSAINTGPAASSVLDNPNPASQANRTHKPLIIPADQVPEHIRIYLEKLRLQNQQAKQ